LFWAHSALVFSGGALLAWFVQDQKIRLEIESGWGIRFFLLIAVFGFLALFFWFLIAGVCSAVSRRESASFLQADAYSYFALIPLASYQNYERYAGLQAFVIGVLLFLVILKSFFLALAYMDRMPDRLSFSFGGKVVYPALFSLMVVLGTHYAHQTSLANYWTAIQENQTLLIDGEARKCLILPAGCSIEYDVEFPEGGSLWVSYAMTETDDEEWASRNPKRLNVYVGTPDSDIKKRASIDIQKTSAWTDVNIDMVERVSHGVGKIRISALGGMRIFTLPWAKPLKGLAVASPKIIAQPDSPAPIIILITVDALRADHLPLHGYGRTITPALDSLAEDGVAFTNAISASTWTIPSNIAMISSLPVAKIKLDVEPGRQLQQMMLASSREDNYISSAVIEVERFPYYTLLDALVSNHYMTAAVTDGGWINSESAFMHGFHIFREYRCHGQECRAEKNFNMAVQIIDSWKDFPLFLWIYSNEVHNTTWHPLPGAECDCDSQMEWVNNYDASIESFDAALGDFIDYLKGEGLYDKTIILLSSDHGNAFGELHSDDKYVPCGHGGLPYEEQIQIPLIVKTWKETDVSPGKAIEEYVSNIDIPPTLLDLAGLKIPEQFEGTSLVAAMRGESSLQGRRVYSDTGLFNLLSTSYNEDSRKVIIFPENPEDEYLRVYDLATDSDERVDISGQIADRQDVIEDFEKFLEDSAKEREKVEVAKPKGKFGDELRDQIRNLGYLQ